MRAAPRLLGIAMLCVSAVAVAATPRASTEGRLVARHDQQVVDVPLEHTDVHIRVDGDLADATVTQRYKNPFPDKIEALYLFPLPTGAAVTDLTITTGSRTIHGSIEERSKAKQVYVAARARGLVAALLTQERDNLFTQSIANLEPEATVEVTLRYVQRLDYDAGSYALVFPMVAGPRYIPPTSKAKDQAAVVQPTVLPPGLRSAHDISLRVELDAGIAIEHVTSSSHQVTIERPSPSRATVAIRGGDTIPNKDFVLTYEVAGKSPKLGVLAHRDGDVGSLLVIAQPPAAPVAADITPREVIFVLDTSSSMRGAPFVKAKELIRRVLWTLRPDDTFQIVRFADRASTLGAAPIANKPRNIELTLDWLAKLEAGGGTEVIDGIAAALALPHDPLRVRLVVFISDGYVGNEDEILASVGSHVGTARLFSFGVGSAVNRYLLEEMAATGRGAVQVVRPDEDTARAVALFEKRIDAPLLTDITLDWGNLPVTDVVPRAVPDLFAGQPLVLAGHYTRAAQGTLTVRAKQAGRAVQFTVPVTLPAREPRPAIATLWARQRIAELARGLLRRPDAAAEREIIGLSLEHRLLSRYTAFVAVDDARVTRGGAGKRVVVPVEVPDAARNVALQGTGSGGGGYGTIGYGSGAGTGYGYSSGHAGYGSYGIKAPSPPKVVIGAPHVAEGTLDAAIIRRYVKRQSARIRYCYEQALVTKPKLTGTLRTEFLIDANRGSVVGVTVTGLGAKEVEACVASVVRSIEFPKAEGGGSIKVSYPFTLQPAR